MKELQQEAWLKFKEKELKKQFEGVKTRGRIRVLEEEKII